MAPREIPPDILAFLADRIDSVPQLEALLMMSEAPARAWTVDDIAARTYTNHAVARATLDALHRRGLLAPEPPAHGFRFRPHDAAEAALVARVASYYRLHVVAVATFIHEKAPASVTAFARAFDLKKDP